MATPVPVVSMRVGMRGARDAAQQETRQQAGAEEKSRKTFKPFNGLSDARKGFRTGLGICRVPQRQPQLDAARTRGGVDGILEEAGHRASGTR